MNYFRWLCGWWYKFLLLTFVFTLYINFIQGWNANELTERQAIWFAISLGFIAVISMGSTKLEKD